MLAGKKILLGVTGGIAAYQMAEFIGLLRSQLVDVRVIMTEAATRFITPLTLETISRHKVTVGMFTDADNSRVEHISLARFSDIAVVAPATANFIGKIASGIADDMLTTTVVACTQPVVICPAMNEGMWQNPAVRDNVVKLKGYGYEFVEPEYGEMACGGEGWGRLASLRSILHAVTQVAARLDGDTAAPDLGANGVKPQNAQSHLTP